MQSHLCDVSRVPICSWHPFLFCLFHPVQYRVVAFITVFLVSFCDVYDRIHRVTHTLFSLIPLARVALFLCLVVQRNNGPRTPNSCRIFATSFSSKTTPFGLDIVVTLNDNVSRTSVAVLRRIFPEIGCVSDACSYSVRPRHTPALRLFEPVLEYFRFLRLS